MFVRCHFGSSLLELTTHAFQTSPSGEASDLPPPPTSVVERVWQANSLVASGKATLAQLGKTTAEAPCPLQSLETVSYTHLTLPTKA